MTSRDLFEAAEEGQTTAEWVASLIPTLCDQKRAQTKTVVAAKGGVIDTLSEVRRAVLAACPDERKRVAVINIFGEVARHAAAHERNVQSVVQAMQQLADAHERLSEGERQFKNDMKGVNRLCASAYPDAPFVEHVLRQEQRTNVDVGMVRVRQALRNAKLDGGDEVVVQAVEKKLLRASLE